MKMLTIPPMPEANKLTLAHTLIGCGLFLVLACQLFLPIFHRFFPPNEVQPPSLLNAIALCIVLGEYALFVGFCWSRRLVIKTPGLNSPDGRRWRIAAFIGAWSPILVALAVAAFSRHA